MENMEGRLDGALVVVFYGNAVGDACQELSSPDNARYQKILESRRDEPLQSLTSSFSMTTKNNLARHLSWL